MTVTCCPDVPVLEFDFIYVLTLKKREREREKCPWRKRLLFCIHLHNEEFIQSMGNKPK